MSHVKTMQSFGQLKGICTGLGGAYKPGQQNLQVQALTTLQFNAQQLMDEIIEAQTAYDNITNRRALAFQDVRSMGSRITSLLRACGAHPLTIADAVSSNAKLQGRNRHREAEPLPVPGEETASKRRGSSKSYASRVQYFAQLVETALAEPMYQPTEPTLAAAALEQKVVELRSLNELVMKAEQTLSRLRSQRRVLFYEGVYSLVNTAQAVRHYIRGVFGFKSAPHAEMLKVSSTKHLK